MFAIAGCGGDTGKAKQDMQAADAVFTPISQQLDQLQTTSQTVITQFLSGQSANVNPQQVEQAATQMNSLLAQLDKAEADYKKITLLSGVTDYVSYANAMIKAIEADKAVIKSGAALLQKILPGIQAGDVAAVNAAVTANMAEITAIQAQANEATKALEQAQQIKTSKKL